MPDPALIVSCEHAVNTVPARWRALLEADRERLDSHRGWDRGALSLARFVAGAFSAPCAVARVSRLLVDHNRSPHHRGLWSGLSRDLPAAEKGLLLRRYYEPFRRQVAGWIATRRTAGLKVVHLSIHTFTPVLDGRERPVDIGILYDPRRPDEACLAAIWKAQLGNLAPRLRVRLNAPYRGRSDCHLTTYRAVYAGHEYAGIELEINQALLGSPHKWRGLKRTVVESLRRTLGQGCRTDIPFT